MADRHNQLRQFQCFTNAVMGPGTINSLPTDIQFLDDIGVHLSWTGTNTGNFQVQVCMDYDPNTHNLGTWTGIIFTFFQSGAWVTSKNITANQPSPFYFDIPLLSAPWLRIIYAGTAGSGVLNAYVTGKGI